MDPELLDILRCPACRAPFEPPGASPQELVCSGCGRRYPVRDEVPILLVDEATGGPEADG